jgi:hypothetical protein
MNFFNTEKLKNKIQIESSYIYKLDIFKPFIDYYFNVNKKCKYELFNAYIFQFNRVHDLFIEHDYIDESYLLPNGKLNLKLKKVRDSFIENNVVYFIGYNYTQNPLFIRAHELSNISKDSNKTAYDFCGFMQESTEPEYKYLTSDCKKLNFKLKNIPFLTIAKTDYDIDLKKFVDSPIVQLSKKTNDVLNAYQNQLK